jgi:hypothetical protein
VTLKHVLAYIENLKLVEAQRAMIAAANMRGNITPEARELLARFFEQHYQRVAGGLQAMLLLAVWV